jgi:uncharacterized protein (TIGR02594 family)
MPTTKDIQLALAKRGFDTGLPDGVWGRRTIAAVKGFQAKIGLTPDGIAGTRTLTALFPLDTAPIAMDPPWILEARRKMGLHEGRDRTALMAWLISDSKTLGDPSRLPWCGDFVETCIALTLPGEPMVANPYFATNWAKFGRELARPSIGAILVFFRNGGGHVGFYVGEDDFAFHTLGGNQRNEVCIVRVAKDRLVNRGGIRWPSTFPLPTTGPVKRTLAGSLSQNEA